MKKTILFIILLLSFNSVKALGSITLNYYDNLTKSKVNTNNLTFKGTMLELSKDGVVDGLNYVSVDGLLEYKNLEKGNYKLEYYSTSDGYYKMKDVYYFDIDNNHVTKDIYLNPVITLLHMEAYYGNSVLNIKYPSKGVKFNIYNSKNELVEQIVTNEKGIAETNLFYDKYNIIESNTQTSFHVSKANTFNAVNNRTFYEEKVSAKLKIKLYETSTDIPIKNALFKINNKEYTTDSSGNIITDILIEGTYTLEQELIKGYYKNDDVSILINKDSNIYLEDNEPFIDITLYNEKMPISNKEDIEEKKEELNEEISKKEDLKSKEEITIDKKIEKEEINTNTSKSENNCNNFDCYKEEEKNKEVNVNIEKLPYLHTNDYYCYLYYLLFAITIIYVKKIIC